MFKKQHITVPEPNAGERGDTRNTRDLLGAGTAGVTQGTFGQNMMLPSMYSDAGMDATFTDNSGAYQKASGDLQAAQKAQADFQATKGSPAARKKLLASAASGVTAAGGPTNKAGKLKGKKYGKYLAQQIKARGSEAEKAAANAMQLTSVKESAAQTAEKQREQGLLTTEQEDLQKSLSMNADDVLAADPALKQALQESEAAKNQAQVGQFGNFADAGGTAGAVQNAAFARDRASAIAEGRRSNIGMYQGLQMQQAGMNSDLANARMARKQAPGAMQQASGMKFGELAAGYNGLLQQGQSRRAMQFQANSFNQTQPSVADQIIGGVGKLLTPMKSSG